MKKFFLLSLIAVMAGVAGAQDPDLEAIAAMKTVKADSLSLMLGKVYGTQAAMNHTTSHARAQILKAFGEEMNMDQQDEQYREGNSLANEFFKVASSMKSRNGIEMNSAAFAKAFIARLNDTTKVTNINAEVQNTNAEAKRLIEELTVTSKDTATDVLEPSLVTLKSDSLSMNMGRFYGMQVGEMNKRKKTTDEQKARFLEGFNNGINANNDEFAIAGKTIGNDYLNLSQRIKKQMQINLNKRVFVNAVNSILNDSKVPTQDDFKALDAQTQAYLKGVQEFSQANSPEALTHRTMGVKYIENIMEKDPGYVQTPSGLVYKVINPGSGKNFTADDKIMVNYKGTHVDGKVFDQSKSPVAFSPNQVVPGFREALLLMRPGAKLIAVLPHDIAYGTRGAGQAIKPYETLIFEIETLGLESEVEAAKGDGAKDETKPAGEIKTEKSKKEVDKPVKSTSTKKVSTKKTNKRNK